MNKLIKLSDQHFIIVDDSPIKEGDWCYDKQLKIFQASHNYNGYNTDLCKKITHSTQPLGFLQEEGITTANLKHDWSNVKQLSLSEVEEAIYGYSVEKIKKEYNQGNNQDVFTKGIEQGIEIGFKAHQELVKEKLFTIEDLRKALSVVYRDWYQDTGHSENTEDEYLDRIIQSLLPKTEVPKKPINQLLIQYDKEMNTINQFESVMDAYKSTNISRTAIANNLSGLSKSAGGFIWKYKQLNN